MSEPKNIKSILTSAMENAQKRTEKNDTENPDVAASKTAIKRFAKIAAVALVVVTAVGAYAAFTAVKDEDQDETTEASSDN